MEFFRASLTTTIEILRSGELNLLEYVEELCSRIEANETELQSLLPEEDRGGRLLQEAKALLDKYPTPENRPTLFGIPVGIKDLYNVDGFPTQAGSSLPAELFTGPEANIVKALRSAGALILGKTAMDEFAYAEPSPTKNPYNLMHTPGGSSSGSAAAVAVGLTPLAIGTQTSRSVTAPASFCGVVGYKPSYGRLPIEGAVLLSNSLDTVGLFTQDITSMNDAARALMEDWQLYQPTNKPVIGVPEGKFISFMMEDTREVFERQLNLLEKAGVQVVRVAMPWEEIIDELYPMCIKLLCGEMAEIHQHWVQEYEALYRPMTLRGIRYGEDITQDELSMLRKKQTSLREELEKTMQLQGIDLWVCPSQAATAPEGYSQTGWGGMTIPWSFAGMPTINLPAAMINGLPLGFQCIGFFGKDEQLLAHSKQIFEVINIS